MGQFHVVDPKIILADRQFCEYMRETNVTCAAAQAAALEKLQTYIVDPNRLPEVNQYEVAKNCYRVWEIPLPEERKNRDHANNYGFQAYSFSGGFSSGSGSGGR